MGQNELHCLGESLAHKLSIKQLHSDTYFAPNTWVYDHKWIQYDMQVRH